ncbi:TPA: DUF2087 domain-containing protein, partial [Staphylococcus pseudintermedius]
CTGGINMNDIKKRFFKNNKIQTIPRKESDKIALFKFLLTDFDKTKEYTEMEVNAVLRKYYKDYAILRRYLVDYSLLKRDIEGKCYKVVEEQN